MTATTEILLLEKIHPAAEAIFVDAGLTVRRHDGALTGSALTEAIGTASLLGLRSKSRVTPDVIAGAKGLHAVGCFCIGTNQVDLDAAAARGIGVFNSPFSNTRSVAEMTLAEIIGLHRRLFEQSMFMHRGEWDKSAVRAHEVRGRTLGIVGYGHIGSQVSVLAEALGMQVRYYDIIPKLPLGNARAVDSLETLLRESDVVTLHIPATAVTRNMIGADELACMRRGAFLINNARGSVVDIDALASAIRAGTLGGAAIDVFPEEPATNKGTFISPLAGLPNVVLTPHIGGSTEEAQEMIAREVAIKLVRYLQTGTTTSAVNVPEVELPVRRDGQQRILHFHRNVPGVLSQMHAALAEFNVNINAEYLQSSGNLSYVIIDVDRHHGDAVRARLAEIPETIRVRLL